MPKHPEEYKTDRFNHITHVPDDVLKNYSIYPVLEVWCNYFLSLGIELQKTPKDDKIESDFPFMNVVKYFGEGIYEVRFYLTNNNELIENDEGINDT